MRVALDTNVLAYAEGVNAGARRDIALDLVRRLPHEATVLPIQVLGELFNVLVKKAGRPQTEARAAILNWCDTFLLVETAPAVMLAAVDLAAEHRLGIWDAVILASAAEAGCRLLLSEDLQDGFTWRGVTVTNPFSPVPHLLLKALLDDHRW